MAIYYLDTKSICRRKGQSVVACAAYRAADKLYDQRYGTLQDYTKKSGVVHSEILKPAGSPPWMSNRETLWNAVEQAEKRKDSRLAREIKFALPRELTTEQNITLAREYIQNVFVAKGMLADWSLHVEKASDGGLQPHVHALLTTREISEEGFGQKVREWNKKEKLLEWRKEFADYENRHLALNGHDLRVDHRTLAAQGIDLIPQDKIGTTSAHHRLDAFKSYLRATRENGERILAKPEILLHNITCQQSTFNDHDIARFVSRQTADAEQFLAVYEKVKSSTEILPLGLGDDGRERFTTRKMFKLENEIQRLSDKIVERKHTKISSKFIQTTLGQYYQETGKQLTSEQQHAVEHLLKSPSISCMVGRAGTGKSFSLGAATAVWRRKGLRVHGIALSGVAADGLGKDTDITSRTIESFCHAIDKGHLTLSKQDVVVMDEAGMTDSVSMHRVISVVHKSRAKLVLVGDPDQLQPVGPGAIFRALLHQFGFSEIVTVYRQNEEWQRQATRDFASGEVTRGLGAYREKGYMHFERDEVNAMNRLVKDWQGKSQDNPHSSLAIVAHTNAQVDKLNFIVREALVESGKIAEGHTVNTKLGAIHLAKDDRILFLKNDSSLGVKNGRFATVTEVNFSESGRVLSIKAKLDGEENGSIQFSPENYKDFTYGYAATVHKMQGATYKHTFNYVGGMGWDRYLTYVANTRHRESCNLYINKSDYPNLDALSTRLSRTSLKDSILDFPRAFAERRGIDATSLSNRLHSHLGKRLTSLKDTLKDRYEAWASPEIYWAKKQEKIAREAKIDARYQQREDNKLVAAYVDTNRLLAAQLENLQNKIQQLGIKKSKYSAEEFALISATSEHILVNKTASLRDKLAAQIMQTPEKYTRALKAAGISKKKIGTQAVSYAKNQRIEAYLAAESTNKVVIRDRLAAEILSDIKGHYRLMKGNRLKLGEIRNHAKSHVRRERLISANGTERETYRLVERYLQLTKQIGVKFNQEKEWQKNNPDLSISHAKDQYSSGKLKSLNLERGKIASVIIKNPQQFEKALDFHQIGKAGSLFNETISAKGQQFAMNRWYKLQSQAALYDNRQRIAEYQSKQLDKDSPQRRPLAYQIMQDIKGHHGAVLELTESSSKLWKAIRQDAKAYERQMKEKITSSKQLPEKQSIQNTEILSKDDTSSANQWLKEMQKLRDEAYKQNPQLAKESKVRMNNSIEKTMNHAIKEPITAEQRANYEEKYLKIMAEYEGKTKDTIDQAPSQNNRISDKKIDKDKEIEI